MASGSISGPQSVAGRCRPPHDGALRHAEHEAVRLASCSGCGRPPASFFGPLARRVRGTTSCPRARLGLRPRSGRRWRPGWGWRMQALGGAPGPPASPLLGGLQLVVLLMRLLSVSVRLRLRLSTIIVIIIIINHLNSRRVSPPSMPLALLNHGAPVGGTLLSAIPRREAKRQAACVALLKRAHEPVVFCSGLVSLGASLTPHPCQKPAPALGA